MIGHDERGARKAISNPSWFGEYPHYWASASLPLAYALACVEVISESSGKARIPYNLFEAEIHYHGTNVRVFAISRTHLSAY